MSSYMKRDVNEAITALNDLWSGDAFAMIYPLVTDVSDCWLVWHIKEKRIIAISHSSAFLPTWKNWTTQIPLLHYSLTLFYGFRPDYTSFDFDWPEQKNVALSFLNKCKSGQV